MQSQRRILARKAWVAVVITIMLVGAALGQAQCQPTRGPLRNQGGVPLKKARPEAGDPLAKAGARSRSLLQDCLITLFVFDRSMVHH